VVPVAVRSFSLFCRRLRRLSLCPVVFGRLAVWRWPRLTLFAPFALRKERTPGHALPWPAARTRQEGPAVVALGRERQPAPAGCPLARSASQGRVSRLDRRSRGAGRRGLSLGFPCTRLS